MINLYNETKSIMHKFNIQANKNLGQNFLVDENVVNTIIQKADIQKEDLVIEIGPGLGTLTLPLLEKAGKVICIELDNKMVEILNKRFFMYNNLSIIQDDILKIDLNSIIEKELKTYKKVKVVANLPYYITTPIVMKLLEDKLKITSITIMIQKEVAERLLAEPGKINSGAITYAIYYYTKPEHIINVNKTCFIPVPKVDSTVIKLNILSEPSVKVNNTKLLFKIIKASFMQRRKTLINGLSNAQIIEKSKAEEMLNDLKIDTKIRGEALTLKDFVNITEYIEKINMQS